MKKRFFVCILCCFSLFFGAAESSKKFDWGYSLSAGIHSGKTQEFVYYQNGNTMSRLDWQDYCSPLIKLSGNLNIYHAILDLDFDTAIPLKCGILEDWDWLSTYEPSKETNYSKSDLTINKDYGFNVKTGYEFLFNNFRILPEVGFKYRNRKYEANGGYYQYGDYQFGEYWSSSLTKKDLYGTVMTYEQQLFMPYIYLDAEYTFCKSWTAKLYGSFIPYIKCDAIDFHCAEKQKLYQYNDFMDNGKGFTVGTEIQFKRVMLSAEYEWIKCDSGNTTQRNISSTSDFSEATTTPGTESSFFTVLVTYKIR